MFEIKSLLYNNLILNSRGWWKINQLLRHPRWSIFCSIHYFGKTGFSFHVRSVQRAADTIRGLCTFLPMILTNCKSGPVWSGLNLSRNFAVGCCRGMGMSTFAFRNGQIMTVFYGIMAVLHIIIDLFNALPIHFGIIFWKQNSIGMQMPKAVQE